MTPHFFTWPPACINVDAGTEFENTIRVNTEVIVEGRLRGVTVNPLIWLPDQIKQEQGTSDTYGGFIASAICRVIRRWRDNFAFKAVGRRGGAFIVSCWVHLDNSQRCTPVDVRDSAHYAGP